VLIQTLRNRFAKMPSVTPASRSALRIGIPKVLNMWSTHQFWVGMFAALGIDPRRIVFSSDTSEDQGRRYAKGRGTVDCCYPVKCVAGHYGELLARDRHRKIDVLFSPMISSLPSFLKGHVLDTLACPRVMAAPENIKAGFLKESDAFATRGIKYVSPLVALGDAPIVARQLHPALREVFPDLAYRETRAAVAKGFEALEAFDRKSRQRSRAILEQCAAQNRPCLLVLARPYHMDPGIGHEIEVDLQAYGYPVLWAQYLPTDPDLLDWIFADDLVHRRVGSPLEVGDVWPSSYSANTNEILWAAKVAARLPWIAGVIRLASYECGMDQPTYSPVQQTVERSGTLFFSFQDLDSTKPAGSVKIRVETIAHYLQKHAATIIERKLSQSAPRCPLPVARHGADISPAFPGEPQHAVL
jgi:predicted nucleotide-binding protein (sugar kinase/HSP70/actin superfamily)